MSPSSYRTAPLRAVELTLHPSGGGVKVVAISRADRETDSYEESVSSRFTISPRTFLSAYPVLPVSRERDVISGFCRERKNQVDLPGFRDLHRAGLV